MNCTNKKFYDTQLSKIFLKYKGYHKCGDAATNVGGTRIIAVLNIHHIQDKQYKYPGFPVNKMQTFIVQYKATVIRTGNKSSYQLKRLHIFLAFLFLVNCFT